LIGVFGITNHFMQFVMVDASSLHSLLLIHLLIPCSNNMNSIHLPALFSQCIIQGMAFSNFIIDCSSVGACKNSYKYVYLCSNTSNSCMLAHCSSNEPSSEAPHKLNSCPKKAKKLILTACDSGTYNMFLESLS